MGRPQTRLEPGSAAAQFAAALRDLRVRAGEPTYRQLAKSCHFSPATLARAASGRSMPSLDVTLAYVAACEGDPAEWRARWEQARTADPAPATDPAPAAETVPVPPRSRLRRVARWAVPAVALVSLAANVVLLADRPPAPAAATPAALDGTDPRAGGCAPDAVALALATVTLPRAERAGDRQLASGAELGTVSLRFSAHCRGAWARFDPAPHTFPNPDTATVTIQAERPAEGAQTTFRLAHVDQTYSDMLLVGVGCVVARVTVTFPDGLAATAQTPCLPRMS